jgi:hypothetical protein
MAAAGWANDPTAIPGGCLASSSHPAQISSASSLRVAAGERIIAPELRTFYN